MSELPAGLQESQTPMMEFQHDETRGAAAARGAFNPGMLPRYLQPANQVLAGNSG